MESIIGLAVLAFVGYGVYKIFIKKETVAEAATEIKNEVVAEAKKVEEAAAPIVKAIEAKVEEDIKVEVTKVVNEVKAKAAKVEEEAVVEVKKASTRAKKAVKEKAVKVVDAAKKAGRPKK